MLRKLGVITAAFAAIAGLSAPARATNVTMVPRTAVAADTVIGVMAGWNITGEATEILSAGSSTTIAASCQAVSLAVTALWRAEPECALVDIDTGARYRLPTTVSATNVGVGSGTFGVPADHDYRLCIGMTDFYSNGRAAGTRYGPCVDLVRGI